MRPGVTPGGSPGAPFFRLKGLDFTHFNPAARFLLFNPRHNSIMARLLVHVLILLLAAASSLRRPAARVASRRPLALPPLPATATAGGGTTTNAVVDTAPYDDIIPFLSEHIQPSDMILFVGATTDRTCKLKDSRSTGTYRVKDRVASPPNLLIGRRKAVQRVASMARSRAQSWDSMEGGTSRWICAGNGEYGGSPIKQPLDQKQ